METWEIVRYRDKGEGGGEEGKGGKETGTIDNSEPSNKRTES